MVALAAPIATVALGDLEAVMPPNEQPVRISFDGPQMQVVIRQCELLLARYARFWLRSNRTISAEDIAQEVWRVALAHGPDGGWESKDALNRWLIATTRLVVLREFRNHRRQAKHDGIKAGPAAHSATPSRDAAAIEARQKLHDLIDRLPATCQEVMRLYYLGEWSSRRIAEHLGITPETVRSHRMLGRRKLRGWMGWSGKFFSDAESKAQPLVLAATRRNHHVES